MYAVCTWMKMNGVVNDSQTFTQSHIPNKIGKGYNSFLLAFDEMGKLDGMSKKKRTLLK